MEKSLATKLLVFQEQIGMIKKDSKNPHFKNTYASLEQILSEVKPILTDCKLILMQPINEKGIGTIIIDADNGNMIESFIAIPLNLAPQPLGSAITYFRRYTLSSLLALEIVDDDAQMASKPIVISTNKDIEKNAIEFINTSTSLEDLKNKWNTMAKEEKENVNVIKIKDELKTKLK